MKCPQSILILTGRLVKSVKVRADVLALKQQLFLGVCVTRTLIVSCPRAQERRRNYERKPTELMSSLNTNVMQSTVWPEIDF